MGPKAHAGTILGKDVLKSLYRSRMLFPPEKLDMALVYNPIKVGIHHATK
jgi:hypothetical protein